MLIRNIYCQCNKYTGLRNFRKLFAKDDTKLTEQKFTFKPSSISQKQSTRLHCSNNRKIAIFFLVLKCISSITEAEQIINLSVISIQWYTDEFRKKATSYRIRIGRSLWSAIGCQRKWFKKSRATRLRSVLGSARYCDFAAAKHWNAVAWQSYRYYEWQRLAAETWTCFIAGAFTRRWFDSIALQEHARRRDCRWRLTGDGQAVPALYFKTKFPGAGKWKTSVPRNNDLSLRFLRQKKRKRKERKTRNKTQRWNAKIRDRCSDVKDSSVGRDNTWRCSAAPIERSLEFEAL